MVKTLLLVDFDDARLAAIVGQELSVRFRLHVGSVTSPFPRVRMRGWQHNGEDVLSEVLRLRRQHGTDMALGMTSKDLYVPDMNFIFGLASHEGGAAVVSSSRLKAAEPTLYADRILKETFHELGHMYGLGHCPDTGCVMHFSNSLADTDAKGKWFCANCSSRLRADDPLI